MFKINDVVNYSTTGVCKVVDIALQDIAGEEREFYILKPLYDGNSTVMVPTANTQLVSHMYAPLSKAEAEKLIEDMPSVTEIWIDDDRLRYSEYKGILSSGNRKDVVGVIKALYNHQKSQAKKGRKLRSTDERIMHDAERLLYGEIAYCLEKEPSEIPEFILKSLAVE